MIDISKELKKLYSSSSKEVVGVLLNQQKEISTKIYLINIISTFNELERISTKKELNLSILFYLDYDNEIGDFFNFKVRNNIGKYVYNKYKLASPKNKSKKDIVIKQIHSLLNNINDHINLSYINNTIEKHKTYEYKFNPASLEDLFNFILSKELISIFDYSVLQNSLSEKEEAPTKVDKI